MKIKKPWAIAILAGLLAVVVSGAYFQARQKRIENQEELVDVVVAKKEIAQGVLLNESHLVMAKIPRRFLQPGIFSTVEDVVGRVGMALFQKGEQILINKTAPLSAQSGLSARIPQGLRALSLFVDESENVAGLIKPNNFVDLLATFEKGGELESSQISTETIAQHILVLAVDEKLEKKTVTLALTPAQAQKIEFAKRRGKISLALRSQSDDEVIEINGK